MGCTKCLIIFNRSQHERHAFIASAMDRDTRWLPSRGEFINMMVDSFRLGL